MFQWRKTLTIINDLPKPGNFDWIERTYAVIYRSKELSIPAWLQGSVCKKMRAWFKDANHVITNYTINTPDDVKKALQWNWQIDYLARVFNHCMPFMSHDGMFLYFRDSAAEALQHKVSESYHMTSDTAFKTFIIKEYTERFWMLPADDEAQLKTVYLDALYHDSLHHLNIQEAVNFAWLSRDNSLQDVPAFRVIDYFLKISAPIQMWNWWLEGLKYWEFSLMSSVYKRCPLDKYWQGFEIKCPEMDRNHKERIIHELLDNFYYFREGLSPMGSGKFEKILKVMVDASNITSCSKRFDDMFHLKKSPVPDTQISPSVEMQ